MSTAIESKFFKLKIEFKDRIPYLAAELHGGGVLTSDAPHLPSVGFHSVDAQALRISLQPIPGESAATGMQGTWCNAANPKLFQSINSSLLRPWV